MAEEEKTGASSTEDSKGTRVGDLRAMIREEMKNIIPELKDLFGGKGSSEPPTAQPTQQQQAQDIKGEVAKALEVLQRREKSQQRDEKIDAMLKAHEDGKVTPPVAPKETRRVHKLMGWGE